MSPDFEIYYRALQARDPRFDGLFFVGVSTTGIYCRSICPARTPKASSCEFFPLAASAEKAGFRPCLRCRPELAPQDSSARFSLEQSLYREIQDHALSGEPMETLVRRTGYSSRQMRRLIADAFGLTPVAIAQTERLLFAKKLLQETSLPITRVALDAGFGSLRRFNHLFQVRYGRPPLTLRKESETPAASDDLRLRLAYRPPLAWSEMLAYLRGRAIPGVESITADSYSRTFEIVGRPGWLTVRKSPVRDFLEVTLPREFSGALGVILRNLRRLFDLDANPGLIADHLGRDPIFARTLAAHPGLRVPGAWSFFEVGVRAILGQQISVAGATTLAGRLAARFGKEIDSPNPLLNRLTASPEALASASSEEIAKIGLTKIRSNTLHGFALATVAGKLDFNSSTSPATNLATLQLLPGIGPWTANYIAMRGLSQPDAFPSADLGLLKASKLTSGKQLEALAENWRPWRAYATLHLWHSL